MDYIESIETNIESFELKNNLMVEQEINLDTRNIDALSKLYLIIHIDKIDKITDITEYFGSIACKFNSVETVLSSDFAHQILLLKTGDSMCNALNMMLNNNPIYFPIELFSMPIYVKNQNISFSVAGVKNCSKIELLYDKVNLKNTFDINKVYPNYTIYLEMYKTFNFNNIQNKLVVDISEMNVQNIFWIYKSNNAYGSKYIHPVKAIGLRGLRGYEEKNNVDNITIRKLSEPSYYTHVQQCVNYTHENNNIYLCSFVLNPERFDPAQGIKYLEKIEIVQEIKPEYLELVNNLTNLTQSTELIESVCMKGFCEVNLIS